MSADDLAFWTTSAQMIAVFSLAFVVEVRGMFSVRNIDAGTLTYKLFVTSFIVSNAATLGFGYYFSVDALMNGASDQKASAHTALTASFALLVVGPLLQVLLQTWTVKRAKPQKVAPKPPIDPEQS